MATERGPKRPKTKTETPEEEMLRFYEPYRYLETEHWGEYLLVAPDGRFVVNPDEIAALDEAYDKFGSGSYMFKVGDIGSGKLPWPRGL